MLYSRCQANIVCAPKHHVQSVQESDLKLDDIFVQAHFQQLCLLHQHLGVCHQLLHNLRPLCMLLNTHKHTVNPTLLLLPRRCVDLWRSRATSGYRGSCYDA